MIEHSVPTSWRNSELQAVAACPACGAAPWRYRHRDLRDELEGTPGAWSLRECSRCDSLMLDPRPTIAAIGKAYASYYTHASAVQSHADDNGSSLFWRLANGYMNARFGAQRTPAIRAGRWLLPLAFPLRQQLDFFYRHLPRSPGRLLDVGCGGGVFLLRAQSAGWQAQGLEPDPAAAVRVRESGFAVHEGALDTFDGRDLFDVITASHVIEHVHEPAAFLAHMHRLLRPSGRVWLATPNVQSVGHRQFGPAWRGLEPPRHITVFSARALCALLKAAGFVDIRLRRRGRGARYVLAQSRALASRQGQPVKAWPTGAIDLLASLSPTGGEELVVTAKKR